MTTLLLLHGFAGAPAMWDDVVAALPPGRHVLRPALGGHAPGAPVPASFDAELDRLADLAGAHAPLHVAGYSLGGRLALGLAARHPALVARVTAIGAHPGLPADGAARAERAAADERWAELLEREGVAAFAEAWAAQPIFASQRALPDAVRARQHAWRAAHDPRALAATMRALSLARMPDLAPALVAAGARAPLPLALLAGEHDTRFTALALALAERVPGARARVVPGAGHNLVLENPRAVAAELAAALEPARSHA
jgi:2-succinyl-6-hydroxy-2,4-cyclohexadiene-1-carboxylate synthase